MRTTGLAEWLRVEGYVHQEGCRWEGESRMAVDSGLVGGHQMDLGGKRVWQIGSVATCSPPDTTLVPNWLVIQSGYFRKTGDLSWISNLIPLGCQLRPKRFGSVAGMHLAGNSSLQMAITQRLLLLQNPSTYRLART